MVAGERRTGAAWARLLPTAGLWGHSDFLYLWGAQSVSLLGSEITQLALPLVAVTMLDASAGQMGLLAAAGTAPFLLCSLLAGVWVDRRQRRPLLIWADLLRAGLLLSVPLAALLDRLHIAQLYAVAFTIGVLTVFFEVAHYAYVPGLVGRGRVIEANSKLQVSYSVSESAGPGIAGALAQLATAPVALLVDAASFLVSALLLRRIRTVEPPVAQPVESLSLRADIRDGLRALLGHPLLRPIVLTSIAHNLFNGGIVALYVLFAVREAGLSPLALGLVFAAGGVGAIPGAMLSERATRRYGMGPAILGAWFLSAAALLLIPLAAGALAALTLGAAMLLSRLMGTLANIQQWSLRQIVTPDHLQGRVTASHRFLVYGAEPLGALLGGALGATFGLRPAIALCALLVLAAPLIALCSPLRTLREPPLASERAPTFAAARSDQVD